MQCTHYFGEHGTWPRERCDRPAEVWIVCPDGQDCPGSWSCRDHAREVVEEYRVKLGENWTMRDLEPNA